MNESDIFYVGSTSIERDTEIFRYHTCVIYTCEKMKKEGRGEEIGEKNEGVVEGGGD